VDGSGLGSCLVFCVGRALVLVVLNLRVMLAEILFIVLQNKNNVFFIFFSHISLVSSLRMRGAIPPLPHITSCYGT